MTLSYPVGPFEFFNPERLWALLALPVLIALYIIGLHFSRRNAIRYTNTGILAAVLPKQTQWRRHVSVAMALCSLVLITGAWARPVGVEKVPRERATIVLVLDASNSMQATDVSPNRMEAAKNAAKSFVAQLPEKYNVAITELSGSPVNLSVPTTDRNSVNTAIDRLEFKSGTSIGAAITSALNAIAQAPQSDDGSAAPGMIILLSDGGNTGDQDPLEAAATAADQNIPIHTIAFGTENGYVDLDGVRENVAPDAEMLSQISAATGGQALDADSASELNNVYEHLQSEVGYEEQKKEVTARWALYALAFAIVASLGVVSMAVRWP